MKVNYEVIIDLVDYAWPSASSILLANPIKSYTSHIERFHSQRPTLKSKSI